MKLAEISQTLGELSIENETYPQVDNSIVEMLF